MMEGGNRTDRRIALIAALPIATLGLAGCVQTSMTRQIQIHKEVNGNVTGFTEIESATQVGGAFKFSGFQYLKGGPRETEPIKIC